MKCFDLSLSSNNRILPSSPFPHANAWHTSSDETLVCSTHLYPLIQGPDDSFSCHGNLIPIMQMLPWQICDLRITNADLFTAGQTVQRWPQSCFEKSCHAYIMYWYLIHSPVLESTASQRNMSQKCQCFHRWRRPPCCISILFFLKRKKLDKKQYTVFL